MDARLTRFFRTYLKFFGVASLILGLTHILFADALFLHRHYPWPLTYSLVGLVFIGLGFLLKKESSLANYFTFSFTLSGIFLLCLALDLGVYYINPIIEAAQSFEWRNIYTYGRDPYTRHMIPNLEKHFRYNGGKIYFKTNSEGCRSDELDFASGERNIVLVGDSFTFGHGVSQENTINQQMKRVAAAKGKLIHVYNLGLSGTCSRESLAEMQNFTSPLTTDYIYIFHTNDLYEIMNPPYEVHIYKDISCSRFKADGVSPNTEQDYENIYRAARSPNWPGNTQREILIDTVALQHLISYVKIPSFFQKLSHTQNKRWNNMLMALANRFAPQIAANSDAYAEPLDCEKYKVAPEKHKSGIERTLVNIEKMRKIAKERGASFHVAITPSINDMDIRRFEPAVGNFICRAKQNGVHVIDGAITKLLKKDYIVGDWHYNASGLNVLANTIVDNL